MENLKISTEKLCGFYVSDWHLVTMILPYINKELNEKANITTILENNIEDNIKTLTAKLNLKSEKEILQINWKDKQKVKEKDFENILSTNSKNNIILINGSKEYIDSVNKKIEEWIKRKDVKNTTLKIVNCYEVTEFNNSIKEILDNHDKILNTSGERYIYEVFEGYSPVKKIG